MKLQSYHFETEEEICHAGDTTTLYTPVKCKIIILLLLSTIIAQFLYILIMLLFVTLLVVLSCCNYGVFTILF